jgi:hypothetical protein
MGKRPQWGWDAREGSWEEAVLSWHEQVERSFLRRRSEAEQEAVAEQLPDERAEADEPGGHSRFLDKGIPAPHQ